MALCMLENAAIGMAAQATTMAVSNPGLPTRLAIG